jgi:hypothetical protein
MIIMPRRSYSSRSRRSYSSRSRRRYSSVPRKRYTARHYYHRASGWNARRWSRDPMERRAALLRDLRADRKLAADNRRKREEARRRRYHRRGLRFVGPRYYQGYNYPIMRSSLSYFMVLLTIPLLIFLVIFFTIIGSSSLTFVIVPIIITTVISFIVLIIFITIIYRKRTSIIKNAIFEEPSEPVEISDEEEPNNVFCPYCGNSIKEDDKRCRFCDAKLID